MVKVLKIDNNENYMVNEIGQLSVKWSPGCKLYTTMEDGSILIVDPSQIRQQYGGSIVFEYEDDKYIIDDSFQDTLIRAGYLVLNEYSTENIFDKERGLEVRKELFSYVDKIIFENYAYREGYELTTKDNQEIRLVCEKDGYRFTVSIDTINNIVTKNQKRKLNMLPFYPFNKGMDKYGTLYISIFAKKLDPEAEEKNKYKMAEDFMVTFINLLNKNSIHDYYRIERVLLKKRIINWKDL